MKGSDRAEWTQEMEYNKSKYIMLNFMKCQWSLIEYSDFNGYRFVKNQMWD